MNRKSQQATTACIMILFSLFAQKASAQVLIPYLAKNGLYGLADESAKVVLPAKFSQMMGPLVPHPIYKTSHFYVDGVLVSKSLISTNEKIDWMWDRDADDVMRQKLQQLIYVNENCNLVVYLLGTNKSVDICLKCPNNHDPYEPERLGYVRPGIKPFRFKLGAAPIVRPNNLMNFVDTFLNPIFTVDFPDGEILDETFFSVENADYKCALADRSGRILTDYNWNKIALSKRKGFFLVNYPIYSGIPWGNMGLIDSNGKIIIEPIYDKLTAITDKLLAASDSTGSKWIDYDGNTILPASPQANWFFQADDTKPQVEIVLQNSKENPKSENLLQANIEIPIAILDTLKCKLRVESIGLNEKFRLINCKEEELAVFDRYIAIDLLHSHTLYSFEMFTEDMYSLLLSPEGKVIKKIEKSQYLGSIDIKGQENYIELVDDMDRGFFVDVKKGIEFREQ
jgi:hypothetical protein